VTPTGTKQKSAMQLCGVFDCAIRGLNVLILRYLRAEYNGTADRVLNMCKSNQQRVSIIGRWWLCVFSTCCVLQSTENLACLVEPWVSVQNTVPLPTIFSTDQTYCNYATGNCSNTPSNAMQLEYWSNSRDAIPSPERSG